MNAKYGFIRSEEGNHPVGSMRRWAKVSRSGYYAWRDRPLSATARRRQDFGRHHRPVLRRVRADSAATGRIRAELARHGIQASALEPPEDHGRKRHDSCQPRKKARTTIQAADLPGRPDRLRRNVTADAPAVTRVGDITLHPDLARIRLPGHGHGAASGKKIIGHAMAGHMRTGLTGEAPTRGHQGPPTGPGRHGVPVPTTRPAGRAAIAGSS